MNKHYSDEFCLCKNEEWDSDCWKGTCKICDGVKEIFEMEKEKDLGQDIKLKELFEKFKVCYTQNFKFGANSFLFPELHTYHKGNYLQSYEKIMILIILY